MTLAELSFMDNVKDRDNFREKLRLYMQNLISQKVTDVGWGSASSVNKGLLQALVLGTACKFDTEKVIEEAKQYFR